MIQAIQLWKDPEGENVFTYGPDEPGNTATGALASCDELNKVATLERTVKHLKAQLTYFKQEVSDLMHIKSYEGWRWKKMATSM